MSLIETSIYNLMTKGNQQLNVTMCQMRLSKRHDTQLHKRYVVALISPYVQY